MRYYNPKLGRFISQDPIGQVDDVNLYAYVGNNPVNAVDLSGLEKILIIISVDYNNEIIKFGKDGYAENWENSYVASTYNRIKSELDRAGKKYDIRLANTFSEFDRAINEKQRDEIKFIGHGTPGYLLTNANEFTGGRKNEMLDWFGKGTGVSHYRINKENLDADIQTREEAERLKNTTLTLYSCNAGNEDNGNSSIGRLLEEHYGFETTYAPTKVIHGNGEIYNELGNAPNTNIGVFDNLVNSMFGTTRIYGVMNQFRN